MSINFNPRARGIIGVRADASAATRVLAELQTTFETFKAERDKELADIKAKLGDVVQTEKVDRINAEISTLSDQLTQINAAMAAMQVGGGANPTNPDVAAHATAFNTWFRRGDRAIDADMRALEVNAALTTQSDPDGGYLVPEQMESGIDRVLSTVSGIRGLSRVINIGAGAYKKLVNVGGTASGWVSESAARPETAGPSLREIVINTHELYANPASTQTALDDAMMNIEQWLAEEVSTEFAEQEGSAYVSGDGVGKPRGFLSYDTVADASYQWGKMGYVVSGAAADFVTPSASVSPADALIDLFYALKSGYRQGAAFVMSDPTLAKVRKMKAADGTFVFAPPSAAGELGTVLGKPVTTDDNMPAVGAGALAVAFGNFQRGYLIADRAGVRVLRDPYTNKPNVHFYTTKRVGGGVVNFEAIKLLKISA